MKHASLYKSLLITGLTFLAALSFSSCKKDNGGGHSSRDKYLTLEVNGKPYTFNYRVNANDKPSEKEVHFVTVGGQNSEKDTDPAFMFQLVVPDKGAQTGTYTTANSELHGQYYYQTPNGTVTYLGNGSDGSSFILNITELSDWGVSGTFSGVLLRSKTGELMTITNGKFSAPYNGN